MPDISMCNGNSCPKKDSCYRFTAKPSLLWQSYFMGTPYKDNDCEYYWPVEDNENKIKPCQAHDLEDDSNT